MAEIKRHEIKYITFPAGGGAFEISVAPLLRPDPHVRADGAYFIRSLYFDDTDYRAYHEKIAGVKERTKYRIRFLQHGRFAHHARKEEQGRRLLRQGIGAHLPRACGGVPHRRRGAAAIPKSSHELARLRQNGWKPAVLVDYVRYPFVYPTGNVRVTIDTELRTAPFKNQPFRRPRSHCAGAR